MPNQFQSVAADAMFVIKPPALVRSGDLDGDAAFRSETQLLAGRQGLIGLAELLPGEIIDSIVQARCDIGNHGSGYSADGMRRVRCIARGACGRMIAR